ncbi:MAG TPA: NAD(P)H-dependent oxidoreductase [Pyrinomonadaceae bacterium]|jgi:FMN reductase|nr:NAD(P)H-dependent oxidoreductase [Pyrinomonadaceae bacterium]
MTLKVLGVSGSMREGSHSARALRVVLDGAAERGAETRFLDLREADLPLYRPDAAPQHDGLTRATEAAEWAEAFVLATPDYHGSMSGAMKNFLDHHWEEFAGKLFGYLCASHEKGLTVMDQMRTAVRQCYGWSLPYGVSFNGKEDFDATGNVTNGTVARRLNMIARDLVIYGALINDQLQGDLADTAPDTFAARYRKK